MSRGRYASVIRARRRRLACELSLHSFYFLAASVFPKARLSDTHISGSTVLIQVCASLDHAQGLPARLLGVCKNPSLPRRFDAGAHLRFRLVFLARWAGQELVRTLAVCYAQAAMFSGATHRHSGRASIEWPKGERSEFVSRAVG